MLLLSLLFEFSISALASGVSQESKWQQISSGLQDSSEYSYRSEQQSG